jgi:acyl-CoA thioesterase I
MSVVVCFGDSLTAGFQSPTRENPQGCATPYGDWLQELLGSAAQIRVSGICGELTGEMVIRFRRDVLAVKPACVAILGGTNDLGWNAAPRDIMRNLIKLYEQTIASGGLPVPITVPSIRLDDSQESTEGRTWLADHLVRRQELNRLIQAYAASKRIASVDLFAATAEADTLQLSANYSNDGIHLTTAGYRLLAERVAQVLKPVLSKGAVT